MKCMELQRKMFLLMKTSLKTAWRRSLNIFSCQKMKIKVTMRYRYTSTSAAKPKTKNKCGYGCGTIGALMHCW